MTFLSLLIFCFVEKYRAHFFKNRHKKLGTVAHRPELFYMGEQARDMNHGKKKHF